MKLKVGDKVRIRQHLGFNGIYGQNSFVWGMDQFLGKVVTVKRVLDEQNFEIKEDGGEYGWTPQMLDPAMPRKTKKKRKKSYAITVSVNLGGKLRIQCLTVKAHSEKYAKSLAIKKIKKSIQVKINHVHLETL